MIEVCMYISSKFVKHRLNFSRLKHIIHFYLLCQFKRPISDCSREEKEIPSILVSCNQKAPYSRAVDMTSNKIKCNIGSFYNRVDRLSCHERCDIVHNV